MVVSWQIMIFNVFWMIFMQLKFSPLKHLFLKILLIFTQNHENPKIWISTMFGPNKKNSKIEFLLKFFKNLEIYVLNSSGVLLYAPETHFWWFYEMRGFQNRDNHISLWKCSLGFQKTRAPELLGVWPMWIYHSGAEVPYFLEVSKNLKKK